MDSLFHPEERSTEDTYETLQKQIQSIDWSSVSLDPDWSSQDDQELPEAWTELHVEASIKRDEEIYQKWSRSVANDPMSRGYFTDEEWSSFHAAWCKENNVPEKESKNPWTYTLWDEQQQDNALYEKWRREHHEDEQTHFDAQVAYYKGEQSDAPPSIIDVYTQWRQETGNLPRREASQEMTQAITEFLEPEEEEFIDHTLLHAITHDQDRER